VSGIKIFVKSKMAAPTVELPYSKHDPRTNTSNNAVYKQGRRQCFEVRMDDGSKKWVYIEAPAKNRNLAKSRKTIMRGLQVYTTKTFPEAPDGIYNWILSELGFFAIPVPNALEFGTRHAQLADRVNATKIYLAGELEKTRRNIMFNLLSGTFMMELSMYRMNTRHRNYASDARGLFLSMGLTPLETKNSLIVKQVSEADLRHYKAAGYKIWLYVSRPLCTLRPFDEHYARSTADYSQRQIQRELTEMQKNYDEIKGYVDSLEDWKRSAESALAATAGQTLSDETQASLETIKQALKDRVPIIERAKEALASLQGRIAEKEADYTALARMTPPTEYVGGGRRTRRAKRL
jgi:hypothetical protein